MLWIADFRLVATLLPSTSPSLSLKIKELLDGVAGCFRLPLQVEAWRQLFCNLMRNPKVLQLEQPPARVFDAIARELLPVYWGSP